MSKRLVLKQAIDRPNSDKTYWMTIGSVFINEPTEQYPEESVSVHLDALPTSQKLRAFVPRERDGADSGDPDMPF